MALPLPPNTGVTLRPSSLGITTKNYLGESQFTADPAFVGSLDEFRIYGRALNSAEVFASANNPTVLADSAATPEPVTVASTSLSVLGSNVTSTESVY